MGTGRRHGRVPLVMPVTMIVGKREIPAVTEDVSRGGMRLRTDQPPPEKRFVQVRFEPSPGAPPVLLSGVTVRVINPGAGRTPGVGVQIYGNAAQAVSAWERFVATVPATLGAAAGAPVHARADSVPVEPTRRRFERVAAAFEVRVPSVDDLMPFASRDVSKGGLFLVTDAPRAVGDRLGIILVHPERDERFEVSCVVRRVVTEAELGIGMGVEFTDLDEVRRDDLWEFLSGGIPDLEEDAMTMLDEEFAELEMDIDFEFA